MIVMVVSQYSEMLDNELKSFSIQFSEFQQNQDRLDHFYLPVIKIQKYEQLSFVIQLICTFNHGQATVQRRFSVNQCGVDTNMKAETMVSKRLIKDHMMVHDLKPHMIEVTKDLINQ